jgi:glycosyltransferase involved in cell wall biosynthesis
MTSSYVRHLWLLAVAHGMRGAAGARRRLVGRPHLRRVKRVVHVSPSYFGEASLIGGGERYAQGLAAAVAEYLDTVLVSFGLRRESHRSGALAIEIYPVRHYLRGSSFDPLNLRFLLQLVNADVVHCHQFWTIVSNLAILAGAVLGKRVCVTDEGGRGVCFVDQLRLERLVDWFLPISVCSARSLPAGPQSRVIYGGVDERFISAGATDCPKDGVLFVGRLLPHKGVDYLIEAADEKVQVDVIGRAYDSEYFARLRRLALGKKVRFVTDASDDVLAEHYRRAAVTVLPSVYRDVNAHHWQYPELLGLVVLESMACRTPVICTNVGALPEIVEDGVTGYLVPPNDPRALRDRINYLLSNPDVVRRMGLAGRERVLRSFSWHSVAARCVAAYRDGL